MASTMQLNGVTSSQYRCGRRCVVQRTLTVGGKVRFTAGLQFYKFGFSCSKYKNKIFSSLVKSSLVKLETSWQSDPYPNNQSSLFCVFMTAEGKAKWTYPVLIHKKSRRYFLSSTYFIDVLSQVDTQSLWDVSCIITSTYLDCCIRCL